MKDFTKKCVEEFLNLSTKKDTIEQIDLCLKHLYEDNTKNLFDQVLGDTEDKLTFCEIISALEDARYDLRYAHALELQYENEPIPTELLIELGLKDEPHLKRIK